MSATTVGRLRMCLHPYLVVRDPPAHLVRAVNVEMSRLTPKPHMTIRST
jgi:hypothetical protein